MLGRGGIDQTASPAVEKVELKISGIGQFVLPRRINPTGEEGGARVAYLTNGRSERKSNAGEVQ